MYYRSAKMLFPVGVLLLLASCHRPPAAQHRFTPAAAPATPAAARPEMVFLSFKATAGAEGRPSTIALLESTVVSGAGKRPPDTEPPGPSYLRVLQLGPAGQVLSTAALEHPLRRSVETAGADGQLQRQDVRLPEAEFFVRLALAPQARTVRVEEVVERQPVGSTDFNLPSRP